MKFNAYSNKEKQSEEKVNFGRFYKTTQNIIRFLPNLTILPVHKFDVITLLNFAIIKLISCLTFKAKKTACDYKLRS